LGEKHIKVENWGKKGNTGKERASPEKKKKKKKKKKRAPFSI